MRAAALTLIATAVVVAGPLTTGSARTPAMLPAATNVPFPTNLTLDSKDRLWLTSGAGGPQASDGVWYLPFGGRRARHVISGLHTALGLTWYKGVLYVGSISSPTNGIVTAYSGFNGHKFAHRRLVLKHLAIGRHTVDSIVPGPGGRLYVGVG